MDATEPTVNYLYELLTAPEGLCANRDDHKPHLVREGSLAPYLCTADQSRRLPYAAERVRNGVFK